MLGIEISALSMAELRQLQEVARSRGQHALVEQISAELRARPGRTAQFGAGQTWAMDVRRMPDPEPPPRRRRSVAVAVTAGAAGMLVAALVWGVSLPPSQALTPIPTSAPRAAMALTSVPLAADDPLSNPATVEAAPPAEAKAPVETAQAPAAPRNPCYDLPTPADRLVCGYPSLADRERRLRAAYRAAIASAADAGELEQAQAAWKAGRDGVSDRLALADLYDQRIRELSEGAP